MNLSTSGTRAESSVDGPRVREEEGDAKNLCLPFAEMSSAPPGPLPPLLWLISGTELSEEEPCSP